MPPESADERPQRRWPRRLALGAAAGLLALLGAGAVLWVTVELPPPGAVQNAQVSQLRFADGTELARVGVENRTGVDLEQVSQDAREAVLAAEDRGFYEGGGISLRGTARAFWTNLRSGRIEQGGSTITQQYARNAFLTSERSWSRKLREAVLAVKLEQTRTKDQVLERYLNTVYFGRGAYGIEAAAQTFFGVPAAELTASQGAVLASQLRAPSAYDPAAHPERARARWLYVLRGMADQGWLDGPVPTAYPAVLPRDRSDSLGGPRGYLVSHVVEELRERGIPESELNIGGLVVETTYERPAQEAAVRAVQQVSGERVPDGVYRALVSVQPGTGRVRAEYGGPDYVSRPFNAVTQGIAQAGSSFKPYVLAAALQEGISLRTRFDGRSPQTFGEYEVSNFGRGDGQDFGRISLLTATASSVNTVYVPLGLEVGPRAVADTAAALGVTADMSTERTLPSISLGVTAVHPIDQAVAYATLAAGGVHAEPYVVERVLDRSGEVVYQAEPETERVLSPEVAADVTFALQQVVSRGSGAAAGLPGRAVAGKTGTTNGNTAAWFVGYTPRLATAVAFYSERQDVPLRGLAGVREVTGGSLPARTFAAYTATVLSGVAPAPFPEPAFVGEDELPEPTTAPTTRAPRPQRTTSDPEPEPVRTTRAPAPPPAREELPAPAGPPPPPPASQDEPPPEDPGRPPPEDDGDEDDGDEDDDEGGLVEELLPGDPDRRTRPGSASSSVRPDSARSAR